jgi:hypothetical protein
MWPFWSDQVLYTPQSAKAPSVKEEDLDEVGQNCSQIDWVWQSIRSWQRCTLALATRLFLTRVMTLVFDFPSGTLGKKVV